MPQRSPRSSLLAFGHALVELEVLVGDVFLFYSSLASDALQQIVCEGYTSRCWLRAVPRGMCTGSYPLSAAPS